MTPDARSRLVKCLGMLSSEHDGEIANAGRMADRLIRDQGLTWDRVIAPAQSQLLNASRNIPPGLFDWRSACRDVLASERETQWERNFCWGLLSHWRGPVLTERQEKTLKDIHEKVFQEVA